MRSDPVSGALKRRALRLGCIFSQEMYRLLHRPEQVDTWRLGQCDRSNIKRKRIKRTRLECACSHNDLLCLKTWLVWITCHDMLEGMGNVID